MLWSNLIHIGYNLNIDRAGANEHVLAERGLPADYFTHRPYLRLDDAVWNEVVEATAEEGLNSLVLALADGIRYDSHPEIGTEGAWSTSRLKDEISRLRELGIEPLPKLNFGAGHDNWLGIYSRMVSTPTYYEVVSDLIAEVAEIFGSPEYFHIGMDEETYEHQKLYDYVVVRQSELWWHDLGFIADRVAETGARPWMWSDAAWTTPDTYFQRMDHRIVQSNWYYEPGFEGDESGRPKEVSHRDGTAFMTYLDLEDFGFDQIPTASVFHKYDNLDATIAYCKDRISPEHLLGFLHSTWLPLLPHHRDVHLKSVRQLGAAKRAWEGSGA